MLSRLARTCGLWLMLAIAASAAGTGSGDRRWEKRWVYVPSNLYVDANVTRVEGLLRRGAAAGYNGVLFADSKTLTWWTLEAADRWLRHARRLRDLTRELGLELTVCVFPFGYAESLLYHDVNLASGVPVRDAPLVARGGLLVSDQTAAVPNGSFETFNGHRAGGVAFQDDPGVTSFIDREVVKDGKVSLRFTDIGRANAHGNGRVCYTIRVKPWQQYRLRAWMKTAHLTGGDVRLLVLAEGRTLQHQQLSVLEEGRRRYVGAVRDLTTDWVEQSVTFNSRENSSVRVYAGVWGGKTGSIWWDDIRVDAVPLLNLLRRDDLPLRVVGEDGTVYEEGRDFKSVADPGLGRLHPWPGGYDTVHAPPRIALMPGARIRSGQRVLLSGYHCEIVYGGQVNCSLDHPRVFELCAEQVRNLERSLAPDGYFMSHDEIRCAGWEPGAIGRHRTTGALLAHNVRTCRAILGREARGKPASIWSDMFDPHHNAVSGYYLVNGSYAGACEGLDRGVTVMKWGGGERARPGLTFFSDRGHRQMIAAYYDGDVRADHAMWTASAKGVPGVTGVMYTTWRGDYSKLETFAETWWGGAAAPVDP